MIRIYILIIILLGIGCKEGNKNSSAALASEPIKIEVKVKTDSKISLGDYEIKIDNNIKGDTSNLLVSYKGKKVESFGYRGVIVNEISGDLNNDGESEIYFTLKHEEQKRFLGMALSGGHPMELYKAELEDVRQASEVKYSIRRGLLVEEYKVPDSEKYKMILYNLVAGEAGYMLKPEGWMPAEINNLLGEYKLDNNTSATLKVEKNNFGEYLIDIKTKQCNYNSIGYFLNKNLIAPLNFKNSNLNGRLSIRFVDKIAIVYTQEEKDIDELSKFCSGGKSIAGTYKKK